MKLTILSLLLFIGFNSFSQVPYLDSLASSPNRLFCAAYFEGIYYGEYVFRDASIEPMFYKRTISSNPTVQDTINGMNFSVNVVLNNNGEIRIQYYGTPQAYGNFSLTVVITTLSGDSVGVVLPTIMIRDLPNVTSDPNPVMCSGDGVVDLNTFVDPDGGVFKQDNTPTSNLVRADTLTNTSFDYEYSDGYCSNSVGVYLTLYTSPTITLSPTNTNCGAATGSCVASIVQGSAPVNFNSWTNGEINTTSINTLAAGQYAFYVEDTNHCKVTTNFTIQPTGVSLNETVTHVACAGDNSGSISVVPVGMVAPVTYIWSSGHSSAVVSNLVAGTYTVYAKDANGCEISKVITVNQPLPLSAQINAINQPTCGASDGLISLMSVGGGTAPINQIWSNSQTGTSISNLPAGVYSVTLTDSKGCQLTKSIGLSENGAPVVDNKTVLPENCGMNDGAIYVNFIWSDTISSVSWSNGATTKDIDNVPAGNYVCTAVNNHNCKSVFNWSVPKVKPMQQDICMVTVDSLTTTNLVVWEKAELVGIDYYNIYRETSTQGEYLLIDTVMAQNISVFNDVVASPSERSWSYRIGAVNFCGVEAPLSFPHRTIHLKVVDLGGTSVQVNWNAYQGTALSTYDLWRYSDANGWELVTTVPSTTLSYTDNVNFTTPGLDYMVEFTPINPCHAEKAQDFNTTRSNRERSNFFIGNGTGNSNNSIAEDYLNNLEVYPNPTSDKVSVVQTNHSNLMFEVQSITGQSLSTFESSELNTSIELSGYGSGVYFLIIHLGDTHLTKRIVKQ